MRFLYKHFMCKKSWLCLTYHKGKFEMAILISLGAVRGNWKNDRVRVSCILQKSQIKWLKRMTAFTFLSCKIVHKRYPGLKLYQKCPWAYYLILASLMCGFQAQGSRKFLELQLSCSFREHP